MPSNSPPDRMHTMQGGLRPHQIHLTRTHLKPMNRTVPQNPIHVRPMLVPHRVRNALDEPTVHDGRTLRDPHERETVVIPMPSVRILGPLQPGDHELLRLVRTGEHLLTSYARDRIDHRRGPVSRRNHGAVLSDSSARDVPHPPRRRIRRRQREITTNRNGVSQPNSLGRNSVHNVWRDERCDAYTSTIVERSPRTDEFFVLVHMPPNRRRRPRIRTTCSRPTA